MPPSGWRYSQLSFYASRVRYPMETHFSWIFFYSAYISTTITYIFFNLYWYRCKKGWNFTCCNQIWIISYSFGAIFEKPQCVSTFPKFVRRRTGANRDALFFGSIFGVLELEEKWKEHLELNFNLYFIITKEKNTLNSKLYIFAKYIKKLCVILWYKRIELP